MSWANAAKLTALNVAAGAATGLLLYAVGVRNPAIIALAGVGGQLVATKVWG